MVKQIRVAIIGYGMQYSRFGTGTYLRNVREALHKLSCQVDVFGLNRYSESSISPILSMLSAIVLILKPWWRYDVILANEGSGAFVISSRKIAVIHHSAKEKARRVGFSIPGALAWLLQIINMKTAKGVVAISTSTWNTIRPISRNRPSRIVWNGVEHNTFNPNVGISREELGLDENLTIAYAARSSPHKNLESLLQLAKSIDLRMNIIFLGSQLPSVLLKKFSDLQGIRVINPGYVSIEKLVSYLREADFYANVSKLEGFGLVQVEAMACGTPVVAFDTDENRRILDRGGIVVTSLDMMAQAIRKMWGNKREYQKLTQQTLNRAKDFSWDRTARDLLNFAKRLFV